MHLNNSSSIAFYCKNDSIPKFKFQKIIVENTAMIAHEIDKLRLQTIEALHKTKKKPKKKSIELILKTATMF